MTPESGWRFYRLAVRPLLIIEHGSAELRGCAPPLSDVGLSLRNRSGDLRGRGLATADASGRFRTELQAEAGGPAPVADGDVVELSASGENTAVAAEPLWLQRQPDGTLIRGGAPERELGLVFGLAGERRVSQVLRTGKQGELRFGIAALPLEADWSPKLAARAWAYMATAGDHVVAAEAVPAPARPREVYLPLAWRAGR